jgi:hypothetical protein
VGDERDRHGFGRGLDGKAVEATQGIGVGVGDDGGQDCRATVLAGQDCGTGQDEEDVLAAFRSVVAKGVGGIVECLAQSSSASLAWPPLGSAPETTAFSSWVRLSS